MQQPELLVVVGILLSAVPGQVEFAFAPVCLEVSSADWRISGGGAVSGARVESLYEQMVGGKSYCVHHPNPFRHVED